MIKPEEALESLRDANVVPSLDELDADELAGVTALFEQRRSSMLTELGTRGRDHSRSPFRRWRPALAFIAALVLVVAVIGVIGLLPTSEEAVSPQPTTLTTPPPTTTGPVATTEPVETTALAPEPVPGWTQVPDDAAVFGDGTTDPAINDFANGEAGLVAVGTIGWLDGTAQGAAWLSADGETWIRAPQDEVAFGPREGFTTLNDVVAYQDVYVASGCTDNYPRLLISHDGTSWSVVDLGEGLLTEPAYEDLLAGWASVDPAFETGTSGLSWNISAMAASGDRIVAVGSAGYGAGSPASGATLDGDRFSVVWTSTDGTTWTRVPHDEAVFGGLQDGMQYMAGVTATPNGFVAVGADGSGPDLDAAVWTSVDGLVWTRVAHDETVFGGDAVEGSRLDQTMVDVVAAGSGILAVGTETAGPAQTESLADDDYDAVVWFSPDGVAWERVAEDESVFGGTADQRVCCAVAPPDGFVVVGYERANTPTWDPLGYRAVVWTSPDGIEWARSAFGEFGDGSFMQSVVTMGTRTIAGGGINNGNPLGAGTAAVWIRE